MQRIGCRPAGPVPRARRGLFSAGSQRYGEDRAVRKNGRASTGAGPGLPGAEAPRRQTGAAPSAQPKAGRLSCKGRLSDARPSRVWPAARPSVPLPLARPNMPGSHDSTAAKRATRPPEDGRPFRALKAGARPIPAGPAKRDASGGTARSRRFHWPGGGAPRRICSRFPSPGIAAGTLCRTARRTLNPLPARKSGRALAIRRTVGGVSVPLDEKPAAALY